jgi:competence protein ComEA
MKKKHAFFLFSRRERYGNTLLIGLFFLLCALPEFLPQLFPPPDFPEQADYEPQLAHFLTPVAEELPLPPDSLFAFDPNTADTAAFVKLGLSPRIAKSIVNYRQKGGKFRKKEDFARIYGLAEADYARLAPYIRIPEAKREQKPVQYSSQTKTPASIDVNQATQEEWQTLRGIGPGYAGRIVRFRDKLGGFSSIEQVGETFGLPDSVFQKIRPMLAYSPIFRKISINQASEEELAAHPYLSQKQARVVCLFRQNHGPFLGWEDLKQIRAIPDSTLQKLIPYLQFEE